MDPQFVKVVEGCGTSHLHLTYCEVRKVHKIITVQNNISISNAVSSLHIKKIIDRIKQCVFKYILNVTLKCATSFVFGSHKLHETHLFPSCHSSYSAYHTPTY